jgi:tight adherence protein C
MPETSTAQTLLLSDLALIAVVLVAYLSAALVLFAPVVFAHPLRRRLRDLTGSLPEGSGTGAGDSATVPLGPTALMGRWLARLATRSFADLKAGLHRAGLRSTRAAAFFIVAKLTAPFVAMLLAWLFLRATIMSESPQAPVMLLSAAFGIGAIWAPDLALKNLTIRYQERIRRAWPDGLDLIYLCIEAGLGLEAALTKVARDISVSSPELAQELTLTVAELAFLQNRREAIENMGRRIDIPAVREATRAISQAQFYGMPLSATLRNLAEESRRQRIVSAEKKSASLPSRLRVPLILFLIPVLFVVILGPAAIDILDLP